MGENEIHSHHKLQMEQLETPGDICGRGDTYPVPGTLSSSHSRRRHGDRWQQT